MDSERWEVLTHQPQNKGNPQSRNPFPKVTCGAVKASIWGFWKSRPLESAPLEPGSGLRNPQNSKIHNVQPRQCPTNPVPLNQTCRHRVPNATEWYQYHSSELRANMGKTQKSYYSPSQQNLIWSPDLWNPRKPYTCGQKILYNTNTRQNTPNIYIVRKSESHVTMSQSQSCRLYPSRMRRNKSTSDHWRLYFSFSSLNSWLKSWISTGCSLAFLLTACFQASVHFFSPVNTGPPKLLDRYPADGHIECS